METIAVECKVKKRLPVGVYSGYWGGYEVKVKHDGEEWFIKTKDGVRGINIPVSVMVTEGSIKIEPFKNS